MNTKKFHWGIYLLAIVTISFGACGVEEDPCEDENTGYIVGVNQTEGIEAEAMKLYIDGEYIGEVPPGGESARIAKPAGKIYEIRGKATSGATQTKDVDLSKCEEVYVGLLKEK